MIHPHVAMTRLKGGAIPDLESVFHGDRCLGGFRRFSAAVWLIIGAKAC